jgi:S-DNA-T family DNA segregation ATPase FtsK/SpoIIIE
MLLGIMLLFSFISYFFTWQADQSELGILDNREIESENWLNKFGSNVGNFFIYQGFGISAFIFAILITLTGTYLFFDYAKKQLKRFWFWGILVMIWLSIFFGFFDNTSSLLSGVIGYESNDYLQDYLGLIGAICVMAFLAIVYLVLRLKVTPDKVSDFFKSAKKDISSDFSSEEESIERTDYEEEVVSTLVSEEKKSTELHIEKTIEEPVLKSEIQEIIAAETSVAMEVEAVKEEDEVDTVSKKLVEDFGQFDPTLELSNFKFPTLELLKDYTAGQGITINQEELEENKNRIVDTLNNYKIGISNIKATVGPTVTLYEIVPEAGVRISKIKNLEDDIALSLSALGIRIIAPIPGRGTIGIEVPNKNPKIVSMRSVIASPKFQNAEMELPIAFGKTISNETFVVDLAKMPHLLMAGATGQGKSVGLNAILTSLLYKKHPAEVKFVLVDPKKVELTLFNKIERHYLAKLPDTEEAIITDTNKVINTLNSLCAEMDARYDLLKDAMVRNIKEYNVKFKNRKLNPNDGHRFLPYIVLVIDEFADLIMTAGKEVETPIARLAQLARAIGIHLIVATQRPSVNVITGIIKANFPARIAFRVTSKIDSRTILDNSGADQLIGRGDMLYTQGNDLTRLQCAFVDTPEVADITDYIGSQKAYPNAYLLPEYVSEEGGTTLDNNVDERDALFRDAAEVLVIAQQGSASLLQRKLKLGYNRAGRIIDQLEAAGVVGPFEGSKARQVLVPTLESLNQLLNNE